MCVGKVAMLVSILRACSFEEDSERKNPEELPCSKALCVEKYLMGYLALNFSWGPMFERF